MKIQSKILIVFALFLGFVILKNSNCYGYTYEGQNVPDLPTNKYNTKYTYLFRSTTSGNFFLFYSSSELRFSANKEIYPDRSTDYFISIKKGASFQYFVLSSSSWKEDLSYSQVSYDVKIGYNALEFIYSNHTLYYHDVYCLEGNLDLFNTIPPTGTIDNYYKAYLGLYSGLIISPNGGNEPDKLNLFELNLTDLDYNNQLHQFNLSTYTNSSCYDELMNYYNNDYHYSIYLTQYARFLSYDSEENKNFQHGSYILSGYIDYLITDKSYFYYSPYYNKVLSNSGNMIFNKDVENYKKRFYFKAVYSEDSNSPELEIWEDNGSLILGDVKDVADSDYFIGSSQTIYYAAEKSNHDIKKLSDRVFYRGYLKRNEDDPVRDISDIPFYRYNFNFSGGANTIFYSSDANYNDEIDRLKYLLNMDYADRTNFNNQVFNDEKYYVQGSDATTSTFTDVELNKDSTAEEFENNTGEIRHPSYNKEDDTSNWGILDFLRGIYNTLTFKNSFDEETGQINNKLALILDKFSFNKAILNNVNEIKDYVQNTQETHKYYLNINHKYLNGQVCVIDLSWYETYKPTVDAFICAFAYLAFMWHMFCMLPNLISGASASSYVSDIQTYKETGFGRSSNIHKGGF